MDNQQRYEDWNYAFRNGTPPNDYFVNYHNVTRLQLETFQNLVNLSAGEKDIDAFLKSNPEVLACCLKFAHTGHHGAWIIPQQLIRPPVSAVQHGLKPDYLFAGDSSDGLAWFILELKGANEKIFEDVNGRVFFTKCANKGVFQLLEYIDYCTENQRYLANQLGIQNFREPNGILLIGRDTETSNHQKKKKAKRAWNQLTNHRLQVRTYDSLLRDIGEIVTFQERDRKGAEVTIRCIDQNSDVVADDGEE